MAVAECIAKLVATGKISKAVADEATALYERSKGEFQRNMGPADAEAAAGLAVARAMDSGAKKLKNDAAKQAIAFADFERTMIEHPDGPIAGVMDQLTMSLRGRGTRNVDTVREDVWARLASMFGDAMNKFSPGILGASKDQLSSAKNVIREIFGESTSDNLAASTAKSWGEMKDYGEKRAISAGRNFDPNENWRVPQPWASERVRKYSEDEFVKDFMQRIDSGGIKRLWDNRTGKPADPKDYDFMLRRAYADITGSGGSTGVFSKEMRTFEFGPGKDGADGWLALQEKYGVGENIVGMLTGHMQRMASEIALAEVVGPNHRAIIAAVMPRLRAAEGQLSTMQRFVPTRLFESASMVEKTYDVLTGRANAVEGPVLAGALGALRSINTAAQLKGAIISSIPGDSVTTFLAANYNGIPITRILDGVVRELGQGGEASKNLAARLQLTAHGAMDYAHGYRFFQDQVAGPSQFRYIANIAIRAQGLQAWTELIKRVFSMEFLGHLADHAGHNMDELKGVNPALGRFLERYQISPAEWDTIRATRPMEVEKATFLDTTQIPDQALAEKLRTAVIQERHYAMLEPDARIRAITTGGLPQGTMMGEIARSLFLFKSFSMTMTATHMMRIFTADTWGEMAKLGTPFAVLGLVAGAASMQAKNILYGKDPQSMGDAKFWAQAAIQGVGLGIYGDMLNSAFTRTGRSPVAEFGGPVAGAAEDLTRLTFGQVRKGYEGKDTTVGAELTRIGRRYTPGTFYTKLAVDRLIWDQLQTLADPDYRGAFKRTEKRLADDTGQQFWFRPGQTAPERGPSFNGVLPQ